MSIVRMKFLGNQLSRPSKLASPKTHRSRQSIVIVYLTKSLGNLRHYNFIIPIGSCLISMHQLIFH